MITADVIVVGAGPAGSTCAWVLRKAGMDVLVLDQASFPRPKPCAGWITPGVWKQLGISPDVYPFALTALPILHFHIRHLPIPIPTRQFAVRRMEFDPWLLTRNHIRVHRHKVRRIQKDGNRYVIDDTYQSRWLVGAGGTGCPVYRTFFRQLRPRRPDRQILSLELEFSTRIRHHRCHLWFFLKGLPGYAWYLPKSDGWVNIGVGAGVLALKRKGTRIHDYWNHLTQLCFRKGWLETVPGAPVGYSYFLRLEGPMRVGNALIAGDAAGLATLDMGEGIGPAIESGRSIAQSILNDCEPDDGQISKWSLPDILFPSRMSRFQD